MTSRRSFVGAITTAPLFLKQKLANLSHPFASVKLDPIHLEFANKFSSAGLLQGVSPYTFGQAAGRVISTFSPQGVIKWADTSIIIKNGDLGVITICVDPSGIFSPDVDELPANPQSGA